MNKIINILLVTTASILFTACTSSAIPVAKSPSFTLGEKDGCKTATGEYTKNSHAFTQDTAYKEGWYTGRTKCNTSTSS